MLYTYRKRHRKEDWKSKLAEIMSDYQFMSFNNIAKLRVSNETIRKRRSVIFAFFQELRNKGFKLQDPINLKTRHIQFMVDTWVEDGNGPSSISNKISVINTFLRFIGKTDMVKPPEDYVIDKSLVTRRYVNEVDKSWTQNEVDINDIIKRAEELDVYSAAQIRMMYAFGLRIREAISICPHKSHIDCDVLMVSQGTKGGRTRGIKIDSDLQRESLEYAKSVCLNVHSNLCDPARSTYQELRHLYYILNKLKITKSALGVTAHGLRHEYLNNKYEAITGHPSPVRGGVIEDKELDQEARLKTMLDAGHSRTAIGVSYYGSAKCKTKSKKQNSSEQMGFLNK